ncbi:MAG: CBS domain-containing protein [Archangium sp.]|nr:CBS domain-containing protein [Archangium sp.]
MQPVTQSESVATHFTWDRATKPARRPREDAGDLGHQPCGELISETARCLECDLEATRGLAVLDSEGMRSAPVVDDNGVLVGVVFHAALAGLREFDDLEVEDAMTTDMVTVPHDASVSELARLMAQHGLERVPVVTHDGHLVGVVSSMDVVRWLAERLP